MKTFKKVLIVSLLLGEALAQTKVSLDQVRGGVLSKVLVCQGMTSPTSDCTGMYYLEITKLDGTVIKLIGTPAPDPIILDPTIWKPLQ